MAAGTRVQLRLGDRVVAEVAFEGAELRIGRMKENDLVINNLAVSRFHAVLRRVGEAFEIEDLGSENGSFVDGVPVRGTAHVAPGAAIAIGKHTLSLRTGAEPAARPAPAPPAAKSDVWDAAQTYFVAGPAPRASEEAVAVAIEGERDEDELEAAVLAVEEAAHASPAADGVAAAPALADPGADPGPLAFDEDELVGAAAPDPVAAGAAALAPEAASVAAGPGAEPPEPEPLELAEEAPEAAPLAPPPPGSQTALFDFGLNEDLGLSDGSLARAAGRRAEPPPPVPPPAPAAPLHAGLIVERLGRVERVVAWSAAELVAGRAPDCDLVLGAHGVSRRHARFVRAGDAFHVRDLGSANGLCVNGVRVEAAELGVGDVVAIDDFTVTFVLDREPVEGAVQSAAPPAPRAVRTPAPSDVLLDAEADAAEADAEKELEVAVAEAPVVRVREAAGEGLRLEITIASERLPEKLRRAFEEAGVEELRLPAELRLVRRD